MIDNSDDPIETPSGAFPVSEPDWVGAAEVGGTDRELSARLAVDAPDPTLTARQVQRALRAYDEAVSSAAAPSAARPSTASGGSSGTVVSIGDPRPNRSRRVLAIVATAAAVMVVGGVGIDAISGGSDATDDARSTASRSRSDAASLAEPSAAQSGDESPPEGDSGPPSKDTAAGGGVAAAEAAPDGNTTMVNVIDLGSYDDLEALRRAPLARAPDSNAQDSRTQESAAAPGQPESFAALDRCVASVPAGLSPRYRAVVGGAEVVLLGVVDTENNGGSTPVEPDRADADAFEAGALGAESIGSVGLRLLMVSDCTVRPL